MNHFSAGRLDLIILHDGRLLRTHGPESCAEDTNCCIHNPSDHPLKDAPLNWRADRGLMERVCLVHGVGHPDPDALAFKAKLKSDAWALAEGVHGCCGCCQ